MSVQLRKPKAMSDRFEVVQPYDSPEIVQRWFKRQDWEYWAEIGADGIRLAAGRYYDCLIPFGEVSRIELRRSYSAVDFIKETFSRYGRVPVRGSHVAVTCTRSLPAHRTFTSPLDRLIKTLSLVRRVFRFKTPDDRRFLELASRALAEYRTMASRPHA